MSPENFENSLFIAETLISRRNEVAFDFCQREATLLLTINGEQTKWRRHRDCIMEKKL